MRLLIFLSPLLFVACSTSKMLSYTLKEQTSVTDALIISIDIVDEDQVWLAGTKSTVLNSKDKGASWRVFQHPEVDTFQYRDIHAFNENEIVVLSIGEGTASQIHLFSEAAGWQTTFVMDEPKGFLNSIDFWDAKRGLAFGDSFDDKPYILQTNDGGQSWSRVERSILPDAGKGEGGFASSGSCIEMGTQGKAWIATGASGNARIFKTEDYGKTWTVIETPMVKGEMAGIMSVHFQDDKNGLITGGDLAQGDAYTPNVFYSEDGGQSWVPAKQPITKGAFYGGDYIKFRKKYITLISGPKGADLSLDKTGKWQKITSDDLWVTDLDDQGFGWLAGKNGKIYRIEFK